MDEQSLVAYHEAGHALLAERLGGRVLLVTICPCEDDGPRRHGETRIAWPRTPGDERRQALRELQVALAGPVAEMIYRDEQYEPELIQEWWADWLIASQNVRRIVPGAGPERIEATLAETVHELVRTLSHDAPWAAIAEIAAQLEAHETLEQDRLDFLRESHVL